MRYQEPSFEVLKLESNIVVTSPGMKDSNAGGSDEGGNLEDIFGM